MELELEKTETLVSKHGEQTALENPLWSKGLS